MHIYYYKNFTVHTCTKNYMVAIECTDGPQATMCIILLHKHFVSVILECMVMYFGQDTILHCSG